MSRLIQVLQSTALWYYNEKFLNFLSGTCPKVWLPAVLAPVQHLLWIQEALLHAERSLKPATGIFTFISYSCFFVILFFFTYPWLDVKNTCLSYMIFLCTFLNVQATFIKHPFTTLSIQFAFIICSCARVMIYIPALWRMGFSQDFFFLIIIEYFLANVTSGLLIMHLQSAFCNA